MSEIYRLCQVIYKVANRTGESLESTVYTMLYIILTWPVERFTGLGYAYLEKWSAPRIQIDPMLASTCALLRRAMSLNAAHAVFLLLVERVRHEVKIILNFRSWILGEFRINPKESLQTFHLVAVTVVEQNAWRHDTCVSQAGMLFISSLKPMAFCCRHPWYFCH